MANWLEKNATPALVSYTLLIAGASWAASTFVLQDNRLSLAQSELAAQKALTEQYKSKADLLQGDISTLRTENAEYRQWLGQTKDAIPAVMPRITALKESVAKLEKETQKLRKQAPGTQLIPEKSASIGSAFIDDATGLIFTVKKTAPDQTATVLIHFPESDSPMEFNVSPGYRRDFKSGGSKYRLTVTYINFIGDTVRFRLQPIANAA